MNIPHALRRMTTLALCVTALCGCAPDEDPATPSATTPTVATVPLEPLPPLRTGSLPPTEGRALTAQPVGRFTDSSHVYLAFSLPMRAIDDGAAATQFVSLQNAAAGTLAIWHNTTAGSQELLVRKPLAAENEEIAGVLHASRWTATGSRWSRWPISVAPSGGKPNTDASVKGRWIHAFAAAAGESGQPGNAWFQFAAGRVRSLDESGVAAAETAAGMERPQRRSELTQLMDTTTGMLSVQEALQHDRGLRLSDSAGAPDIEISTLAPPALQGHPFAEMRAALPQPDGGTPEPLAAAVPAEFWYARVDDLRLLLRLLDEADAWLTPLMQILEANPEDRQLSQRYQAQLGLKRSGMAKLFGHTVVGPVAVVGSDPYLRDGSDVTLLFSIRQQAIFDAELARHLAEYRKEFPDLAASERQHAGVKVLVHATADGRVRQQRAQVGELALVSNSAAALDRVLEAIGGTRPRLSDEPDLQYLLARDPGAHQAMVFLSDRFIGNVVGPQQKVLAARRQLALAELLTPGHAALLYGWLNGRAPTSSAELLASGLLSADELRHGDGAAITFVPGASARSAWGTPAALTPLIDLAPVTKVSAAEQAAYLQFVTTYQQYWRQFIDPVAVRLDLAESGGDGSEVSVDVRILPLISGTDYSEIDAMVGKARVEVPRLTKGLQAVWGVGADARLRRDMDGFLRSSSGQQDLGLGWLGDWVALGLDDRATLVELLSHVDREVQLPMERSGNEWEDREMWRRVGKFPIYAAAEVRNPLALVAALTALRGLVNQVAPGMIEWGEVEKHRDLAIVRVGVSKSAPMLPDREIADAIALHYLQTGSTFVLALNPETLKAVADRLLDGQGPKSVSQGSAQFVFDARTRTGAPLWTALLWLIQGQAYDTQRSARRNAEALLRGDPALAGQPELLARRGLDYFGFAPLTAQGDSRFELRADGAADAISGSTVHPNFVQLPVAGSPVAALMQRLVGVRGEVSFDQEPAAAGANARSLHTRFVLQLGAMP